MFSTTINSGKMTPLHFGVRKSLENKGNSSFGGKTRGSEYFNQAKDVDLVTSLNKVSSPPKKEKVEDFHSTSMQDPTSPPSPTQPCVDRFPYQS